MGTCSSSTKNRGWAVTRRRCLNGLTVPTQAPTPDAKLAARVYGIDLHRGFACASLSQPDRGESCIVLENGPTRNLIAKLPQRSSLAVCEFRAAGEKRCKQGYGGVYAKL